MTVQAHAYLSEVPDLDEFERFWRRVHGRLHRFALRALDRADADEIVQETMIRCYENWERLDPQRDPWPWVVTVARRISTDHLRARMRREARESALLPDEAVDVPLDERVCADELSREVHHALRALPENDRTVLALHHLDGMSIGEIADLTGRTDNAVRQCLFRARRRMADEFRRVSTGLGAALLPLRIWTRRTAGRAGAADVALSGSLAACVTIGITVTAGLGMFGTAIGDHAATSSRVRATAAEAMRTDSRAASDDARDVAHAAGFAVTRSASARAVAPRPRDAAPPVGTVDLKTSGNPVDEPDKPNEQTLTVQVIPGGDPLVIHHQGDMTPGWSVVCALDLEQASCD